MTISIREIRGYIHVRMKWKSRFGYESKEFTLTDWPIGRMIEEILKHIQYHLKDAKSAGKLRF